MECGVIMLKGKFKSKFLRKKLLFITLIVSMSLMGIGYAVWNDGTKMNVTMKTGFVEPLFYLENNVETFNDGKLSLSLSDDRRTLNIEGEVYPKFNEDLTIKIIDEGTIPSVFKSLDEQDEDISELNRYSDNKRNDLYVNDNYIESFKLKINPDSDNGFDSYQSQELSGLEQAIEALKEEIRLYDREEDFKFKYVLNFEQGL